MPGAEVDVLLEMIDQAFDRRSWNGPNLRSAVRGLTAREAAWRPDPRRHNIWEIAVHAAYWKYIVRRRLLGGKRGSFPHRGTNWFERPVRGEAAEKAWKADVALLVEMHGSLRAAVEGLTTRDLRVTPRGARFNKRGQVVGVAAHDIYHTGQIQLIRRMLG